MLKRILLLSLFCLLTVGLLTATEYLEYHEKTGESVATHRFVIEKKDNGFKIQLTSTFPDKVYLHTYFVQYTKYFHHKT